LSPQVQPCASLAARRAAAIAPASEEEQDQGHEQR
jgi:hypothetical protein